MTPKTFHQPLSGNDMPRFGGPGTFMRLPALQPQAELDAAFVGIPLDIGTSNRPGARLAPREIRDESRMLRPFNVSTGADPFNSLSIADIGDVPINTFNLGKSLAIIEAFYDQLMGFGICPLTLGGDHSIVLPILRALHKQHGPLGLVHVDAHADCNDTMFEEKYTHGTPFRRAVEEGLLDNQRVVQIGLRGTGYSPDEYTWSRQQGFRVVQAEDCWHQSLKPLMAEVSQQLQGGPVYISFDIDGLDPAFAPGTGTAEVGGLTTHQGLEIVRACRGLEIVGGDLVEVSPPYDLSHNTSLLAANLLFEMLCVLPGVSYIKEPR